MHIAPLQATHSKQAGLPPQAYSASQAPRVDFLDSPPAFAAPSIADSTMAEVSRSGEVAKPDEMKEAFSDFVGQTFFGEMIKAFRTTQQPSKYFHGGRAEEIFQGQFDQVLTEKLSDASAEKIADPMFELFMLKRSA